MAASAAVAPIGLYIIIDIDLNFLTSACLYTMHPLAATYQLAATYPLAATFELAATYPLAATYQLAATCPLAATYPLAHSTFSNFVFVWMVPTN